MHGQSRFPKGVPWVRYHGNYKGLRIDLVWPGKDPVLGKFWLMCHLVVEMLIRASNFDYYTLGRFPAS
jgi:hypothetical protein